MSRFCWHKYSRWSDPFSGVWNTYRLLDGEPPYRVTLMSQRRECSKCGKVQYRKCT